MDRGDSLPEQVHGRARRHAEAQPGRSPRSRSSVELSVAMDGPGAVGGVQQMADRSARVGGLAALQRTANGGRPDSKVAQLATRPDFQNATAVAPNPPTITGVNFGPRPPARVEGGGGGQGDHLLAWTVFEWHVVNELRGRTFQQGVAQIRSMAQRLESLPGFEMGYPATIAHRTAQVTAIVNAANNITNGTTVVAPINQPQVLGDLIDDYLRIRNDLHLVSRAHTPGATPAHVTAAGATGLQNFAPVHPLTAAGLLAPADLTRLIGFIDNVFDYHGPDAANRQPERAGLVAAQVLSDVFAAFRGTVLPAWHAQIEDAFEQHFIATYPSAVGWNAADNATFNEAYSTSIVP